MVEAGLILPPSIVRTQRAVYCPPDMDAEAMPSLWLCSHLPCPLKLVRQKGRSMCRRKRSRCAPKASR